MILWNFKIVEKHSTKLLTKWRFCGIMYPRDLGMVDGEYVREEDSALGAKAEESDL